MRIPDARDYENLDSCQTSFGVLYARKVAGLIQHLGFDEQQAWDIIHASRPSLAARTTAYGLNVCDMVFDGKIDVTRFLWIVSALSSREVGFSAKVVRQAMRNVFGFPLPPARRSRELFDILRGSVVVISHYLNSRLLTAA